VGRTRTSCRNGYPRSFVPGRTRQNLHSILGHMLLGSLQTQLRILGAMVLRTRLSGRGPGPCVVPLLLRFGCHGQLACPCNSLYLRPVVLKGCVTVCASRFVVPASAGSSLSWLLTSPKRQRGVSWPWPWPLPLRAPSVSAGCRGRCRYEPQAPARGVVAVAVAVTSPKRQRGCLCRCHSEFPLQRLFVVLPSVAMALR
jgi:hypothetical protein